MNTSKYIFFSFFIILLATGCGPKFEHLSYSKAKLQKVEFKNLKEFENDDLSLALDVFKKACVRSKRKALFKDVCKKAYISDNAKEFFTKNFTPYKLHGKDGKDTGVITGYYEPLLYGSLKKTKKYKYPVYGVPKNLITVNLSKIYPELKKYRLRGKIKGNKLIPFNSRSEISNNEEYEVLCYVNSKIDLYFLQIQGSGKVQLEDGTLLNIGYANQNGRKYKSIGRYMIKKGYIGNGIDASMQGMKKWFEANPLKADAVLNKNNSYVFFEKRKTGATGSLGVPLVAKRNLAVDTKYIPLGMPVFINTKNPVTRKEINTLMLAADTGGAIKGEIRADFFWGYSKEAAKYAGRMKEQGELYILVPNI